MTGSRPDPTVGVLGLGAMGAPIARHLLKAGISVTVFDLDDERSPMRWTRGLARGRPGRLGCDQRHRVGHRAQRRRRPRGLPRPGRAAGVPATGTTLLVSAPCGRKPASCSPKRRQRPWRCSTPPSPAAYGGPSTGPSTSWSAATERPWTPCDPSFVRGPGACTPGALGAGQVGKTANNLVHWAQICAITEALELARRWGVTVPALRAALMDGPTSRTLRELEDEAHLDAKDLANAMVMAHEVAWELPSDRLPRPPSPTSPWSGFPG